MLSSDAMKWIEDHVSRNVGRFDVLHEIIPLDLHIDVLLVKPTRKLDRCSLVTMGMCERAMTVPQGEADPKFAELMMCLPSSWKFTDEAQQEERYSWPLFWLQTLARFPHQANTFLAPGHTIPNGDPPEPIGPDTEMRCILIREPVATPEAFRTLKLKKKTIHFYALVPLYREEMEYKIARGYEALTKLLDEHHVTELLDPKRPSVCPKK
jgi:hypothetical protein